MDNSGLHWGLAVAFFFSIGIVLTKKWHGKFTFDGTSGIQKFHSVPTPRIGGVAIMAGLIAASMGSEAPLTELLGPILVASLPAFCFGLAEDLTKRVAVRTRLLATMASGFLAWLLTGVSVTRTGIVEVDNMLSIVVISVLFTAFAVGGVANSVNIIDGFNGLASGTVAICLISLGLIARDCGDFELAALCFSVCAVTIGFFLVNFPLGKLFLGDGGAYLLGFLVAWLAVMLSHRNPSVSALAPLVACAYPIFETVFTIARRLWARSHPGQPDSHHLHSLVKVCIAVRLFPNMRADFRNASVSPVSWAIAAVPAAFAVRFADRTDLLLVAFLFSFLLYLALYRYVSVTRQQVQTAKIVPLVVVDANETFPARHVS